MSIDFGTWPIWAGAALIFLARVADVTLGTLRISFISRGEKNLAPLIGFVEMLIWLLAISQLVQNLTNVAYYLAYAGGFATGVFAGLRIEERIALGRRMIRTITEEDTSNLLSALRAAGFGVTSVRGAGGSGDVSVIFSVVKRAEVRQYMEVVEAHHPEAFTSIEEVRSVHQGVFRASRNPIAFAGRAVFPLWRK
ncbi:MAG: DUF2179 domain-containing protein [Gemmatimonadota bacterium]|nr:DUF2179 domain-containing protein [Gemmatimonadota bacterium]